MKLAMYASEAGAGRLVVVSADLTRCQPVGGIALTLADALADWARAAPVLEEVYLALSHGHARHAQPFRLDACLPLGRGDTPWLGHDAAGRLRLREEPATRLAVPADEADQAEPPPAFPQPRNIR